MDEATDEVPRRWSAGWRRVLSAIGVALVMGLGSYWLLSAVRPQSGLISFSFLLVLPAAICALGNYIIDPWGRRSLSAYLMLPIWVLLGVVLLSVVVLREGVICIVILSPLWVASGLAGSAATWWVRRRLAKGRTYGIALFALPFLVMEVEPYLPLPEAEAVVTRSVVIDAPAERIWPFLRGIPDVKAGEGQWNVSQDVLGVPRPRSAKLVGEGLGAERRALWTHHIRFREHITQWRKNERIGWRFIFDDLADWNFTDPHLLPDSAYFRVMDGGYSLQRLGGGRTRVTLDTRYRMRTPVNTYSALWGEFFLGDLEDNLLALVKQRAERDGPA